MKVAEVQFVPWDRSYYFLLNDLNLDRGNRVIVKTELGTEIGEVVGFADVNKKDYIIEDEKESNGEKGETVENKGGEEETRRRVIKPILRLATEHDLEKIPSLSEKKEAIDFCRKMKTRYDLPMKVIDVHFSFDASRITFAFIADGRVDFRELVKELTRHFGRTIRLQQIGIRDEAKIMGDFGHCGQGLCCRGHLKQLESITSEMAELQQCSHRGSERISGVCGRLMCCLAYEQNGYEEAVKTFPPIGAKVNVDGKRGVIVGQHILKRTVDVEFSGENGDQRTVAEISLDRNKKK